MQDFLKQAGWDSAKQTPITPDWSPRHFLRLTKENGDTAVVIHAPQDIPGHSLTDFVTIAALLRTGGLSAPDIYAQTPHYLLVEDFGETPIDTPAIEREAYETAVDTLAQLRQISAPLTPYKQGYIYKKITLFSDAPAWMAAWKQAEEQLPPCPQVLAHMDYKAGNLHWLPERESIKRIGILDFQAAQIAPFTYDIVNLLEDARRDIEPTLKAHLKARFYEALPQDWKPLFEDWYIFMSARFHAGVLGQIRNNPRATPDVMPRLQAYLTTAFKNPLFNNIKTLMDTTK